MAERDLDQLLKTLEIERMDGLWLFETSAQKPAHPQQIMMFQEREGWTSIRQIDADTPVINHWVWLELSVYSDLHAVGFLARIAEALALVDVPCNAVAAFHHDHVFVPVGKAEMAITALNALSARS